MAVLAWNADITQVNTWVAVGNAAPSGGMTVNISVANRDADNAARIDVCISNAAGSPSARDFIEEFTYVKRGTPLIRTGEPMKEGERVFVRTTVKDISVRVSGFDKL